MVENQPISSKFDGFEKLSVTEIEILYAIQNGSMSGQIAEERNCSIRTVEKHRSNIIQKLGLSGKPNALFRWVMLSPKNSKN